MKNYNEIIRELCEDNDLNQKQVAELLGTTQQVYSRYETDENELPIHHLITLAKYYKTSTDFILGLTNERKPYSLTD
ncbi:MAG: helix-turn-helix domain-containing protein [Ruminiclostridium sp.]